MSDPLRLEEGDKLFADELFAVIRRQSNMIGSDSQGIPEILAIDLSGTNSACTA
jgi:hypothetical protein